MSKLFVGKIDVTKIVKEHIFKGKKGQYVDVAIWINDTPDNYGYTMAIKQSWQNEAGERQGVYIGNCKEPQQAATTNVIEPEVLDEQPDGLPF